MRQFLLLTFSLLTLACSDCFSTHLRGGSLQILHLNDNSYEITILVYTKDTGNPGDVLFGGDGAVLDFGDGTTMLVPYVENTMIDPSKQLAMAKFTIIHNYSEIGRYYVSYREPNRNEGVINFSDSEHTEFYIESSFLNNGIFHSTPTFLTTPIFFGSIADMYQFSAACIDSANYTLYYELVTPLQDRGTPVNDYKLPENISINQYTGQVNWDTKFNGEYVVGEYTFAVKIYQVLGGKIIGYVIRDFQVILEDDNFRTSISDNKALDTNNRIFLDEGESASIKIFAEDIDVDLIELTAVSELSNDLESLSFSVYDSAFETNKIKVGVLNLKSNANKVRDNPYAIVVRVKFTNDIGIIFKDITYLLYTKDIELPPLVVTSVERSVNFDIAFPNPTSDFVIIDKLHSDQSNGKLYSINGELVIDNVNLKNSRIDLSNLPSGLYVLKLFSEKGNARNIRILKK
jgi:hypothetical protein